MNHSLFDQPAFPRVLAFTLIALGVVSAGCRSSESSPDGGGTGGASNEATGGATPTGIGGGSATGGALGSGGHVGSSGSGGGTGGSSGSGGATGSGGLSATGGATPIGGSGGATGSGGLPATGGATPTGGSGGVTGSGGAATGDGGHAGSSTGRMSATGGGGGARGSGGAAGNSALLVPDSGVLFGAFVGTGTLDGFESTLGRTVAINHTFVGWTDDYTTMLPGLAAGGRIPLVTWEAWENNVGAPLTDIIGGTYDAMIMARATAAKAFGQRFFLRWGHEMNGNWYPWGGANNGADTTATMTFITAYRHVHDLFVAAGATNVLWIFCPNVDSVPGDSWNQWQNYYPGDDYVDWVGLDGYNWGTVQSTSTWQSFSTIVSRIYAGLAAKGKPIIIPETASTEMGGDKAAWIAAILPALKTTFPAIKAFVWFQMNKETDWRVDSSPASQAAFITMVTDPYFNP